jgi:hypothetical protein
MMLERILEVGGVPVMLRVDDPEFQEVVDQRYGCYFTDKPCGKPLELTVQVTRNGLVDGDNRPRIERLGDRWVFERSDFQAEWHSDSGTGGITQEGVLPYPLDSVLRILHSLMASPDGGCMMHAASAVRNGRAFVFTGVSGSGKTTISCLAPPDVAILSDDISLIRPVGGDYHAFGTPFVGEYGKPGKNISAPLEAVYLLAKGPENIVEPLSRKQAVNVLLRNILLFHDDPKLSGALFDTAWRIAACVQVYRLTFAPTPAVWEIIV